MNSSTLVCKGEKRRHEVRKHPDFNGLDYLEVLNPTTLCITFLDKAPRKLSKKNVVIRGGRRIREIEVVDIDIFRQPEPDLDDCLEVTVNKTGDFSTYTVCLVELDENGHPTDIPLKGFDPRYYCLDFTFKIDCPSDLDCLQEESCPPPEYDTPEINYLAKDYASFRQLILDRLALIMPDWQERHVPDIGITLVEVLAYAGDYLSYYQDAVATEAYLGTARQRISVRRHARLVDYLMHEGCNARAWVHIKTESDFTPDPEQGISWSDISFITGHNDALPVKSRLLTWDDLNEVPKRRYEVFAPLVADPEAPIQLYKSHNEIYLYTWGDEQCCLPRGTTSATLIDGESVVWPPEEEEEDPQQKQKPPKHHKKRKKKRPSLEELIEQNRILHLKEGDVIIFEEVKGSKTGVKADADRNHRHAVRLTSVEKIYDPLDNRPLLEVAWHEADALPFPLCIFAIGPPPECELLENISVARGNVILVDHGRRYTDPDEGLWCVPLAQSEQVCCDCSGLPSDTILQSGPFNPRLKRGPLTHAESYPDGRPAAAMLEQDPRQALPWIKLASWPDPDCGSAETEASTTVTNWQPQRDLLSSQPTDNHFVAEIDNDGRAKLRFGDGELGRQPAAGLSFSADYRVGIGRAGNVGAEAISHVVSDELISGADWMPRNPLPARGGVEPQTITEVKRFAPHAFRRRLERAITAEDYAQIVMRDFPTEVQRAAAVLRWTGSWFEALVAVDQFGRESAEPDLLARIKRHLRQYRRMGHDLAVKPAYHVPIDVELRICVDPDYLRGHVKAALLARFSNRALPDGSNGFFHPDTLSFGEGIFLSKVVATAQAVPGVSSVQVTKLERLSEGSKREIENGVLPLGPLEIAQVENDPSFPEHGRLNLIMEGGR